MTGLAKRPILYALAAAALFGASTPAAKALTESLAPLMLAGLLYAGSGLGLCAWLLARRLARAPGVPGQGLSRAEAPWLAGAVFAGGVLAPALLIWGLTSLHASTAALLLNLEGVFTALLAWFVFGENFDRRIAVGMVLIVTAGLILSFDPGAALRIDFAALLIAGACLCWAIDNNLTRRVSGSDATTIAAIKGCAAGTFNLAAAAATGAQWPTPTEAAAAMLVGLGGYGLSLVLFVLALRGLGTARTAAYFATAPFVGVAISLSVLGEPAGVALWLAMGLMSAGLWLHVRERHDHVHEHAFLEHEHEHVHDAHHRHAHAFEWDGAQPHAHRHVHEPLTHSHPHYPDIHHRHRHPPASRQTTS